MAQKAVGVREPRGPSVCEASPCIKELVSFVSSVPLLITSGGFEQYLMIDLIPNPLLFSSFPFSCVSVCMCVLFVFLCWWLVFSFPYVVVLFTLQNSSSSASSEASETCQSVSECSSPTSVSSGSTMGAWASTDKVKNFISDIQIFWLISQAQTLNNSMHGTWS